MPHPSKRKGNRFERELVAAFSALPSPPQTMPRPKIELKKQRKAGSIDDALMIQWRAIKAGEEALYYAGKMGTLDGVLRAVHAISQAAGVYGNLKEKAELEARLATLEKLMENRQNAPHYRGARA